MHSPRRRLSDSTEAREKKKKKERQSWQRRRKRRAPGYTRADRANIIRAASRGAHERERRRLQRQGGTAAVGSGDIKGANPAQSGRGSARGKRREALSSRPLWRRERIEPAASRRSARKHRRGDRAGALRGSAAAQRGTRSRTTQPNGRARHFVRAPRPEAPTYELVPGCPSLPRRFPPHHPLACALMDVKWRMGEEPPRVMWKQQRPNGGGRRGHRGVGTAVER